MNLLETDDEDAALTRFGKLGYAIRHGPLLAPGEPAAKGDSFGKVLVVGHLREAITRLSPALPVELRGGVVN